MTSDVIATINVVPNDDPESVWAALHAVTSAAGIASLPAARLTLAAVELVGFPHGPTTIEVAKSEKATTQVLEAVVQGGAGEPAKLPAGLVDSVTAGPHGEY